MHPRTSYYLQAQAPFPLVLNNKLLAAVGQWACAHVHLQTQASEVRDRPWPCRPKKPRQGLEWEQFRQSGMGLGTGVFKLVKAQQVFRETRYQLLIL